MAKETAPGQNKQIKIVINGTLVDVEDRDLTFDEVVRLAFPNFEGTENTIFTVAYSRGQGNKPEGTLVGGETLKLKKGMILNVAHTDKS